MKKGKVTGIGGIFFKSKNPQETTKWYADNLGFKTDEYGAGFKGRDFDEPGKETHLQWSVFSDTTKYMEPSQKEFMINYRVENMEELVEELRANGVTICDEIETFDYGKFIHILDNDGNKIELWEPVDSVFTEMNEEKTTE